jgi:hypothetical protein
VSGSPSAAATANRASGREIAGESGLDGAAGVGAAIVAGHDLEILMPRAAVSVLVLDPRVWKPDVTIVVRQLVFPGPSSNLFGLTVRPAVAVLLAAIALVEESLVVALQLVVQDHAVHSAALLSKALLGARVGAIDLRVVRQLARLSETRVERLLWLQGAVISLMPICFEQVSTAVGEEDRSVVGAKC